MKGSIGHAKDLLMKNKEFVTRSERLTEPLAYQLYKDGPNMCLIYLGLINTQVTHEEPAGIKAYSPNLLLLG